MLNQRPGVERRGEFGIYVEQQFQIRPAEIGAQPQGAGAVGLPETHVARVYAGEHLSREGGARRDGQRHRGDRIPEVVDAERHAERRANCGNDRSHRGKAFRGGLQHIGAIALVAEHDRIDAPGLKGFDVAADVVSPGGEAKPKTTKRKVEPKAPPVVQPDIGATPPEPVAPPPRRSTPGRWFNTDGPPGAGPDPAGR